MRGASSPSGPPESAGGARSLQDFLFGPRTGGARAADRRPMPAVARFRLDGGDGFVLERGSGAALLKFEDSSEVWALTATAGPRGDTIFKNDVGDPVLRMTRLGGMTLFTDDQPEGMPAAIAGVASTVRPATSIGPDALLRTLAQSSVRASRAAQHLIIFDAPKVKENNDWLFADAASIASEAFVRLCSQLPDGRALASRFARVVFLTGGAAEAETQGSVVQITIAPSKGVAGRPSSERIFLVLRHR